MQTKVARFKEIFSGGDHAHGVWDKDTGDCQTIHSPASDQDYEDHLSGVRGLGLVPVRRDGTCRFGAIDIDVDTIDHAQLRQKVKKRGMPLNVCRSKSGGAHLYLVAPEPGVPATKIITLLKRWAALLGYPRAEVFPKQARISKSNLGNWINAPYFAGDKTTRYCVDDEGALTLLEFFDRVQLYDGSESVDESIANELVKIGEMPPCLASMTKEGLPEGGRNQGLLNFGIFYRKSNPNGWEDLVVRHNQLYVKPPLPNREVQTLIKQVGKHKYQYTCDVEPLCSRCDRKTCLTLPFGVGHKPWEEVGTFDDLLCSHLRKVLTDPPSYTLEVNGRDVTLNTDQFFSFTLFRKRVFESLDLILAPMKQESWEQSIRELLGKKKDVEAPKDASLAGLLQEKVHEYLQMRERAKTKEDLIRDVPVDDGNGMVLFRVSSLKKFLLNQRFERIEPQELFAYLHALGCEYGSMRVLGKVMSVWKYPIKHLSEQSEDFNQPNFENVRDEI